jgi:hypothetical protein
MPNFSPLHRNLQKISGTWGAGNNRFSITRPDYTSADHTGTVIRTNAKYRLCDTANENLILESIPGMELFTINGSRDLYQEGDVFTLTAPAGQSFPVFTAIQKPDLAEAVAFKTDKLGRILDNGAAVYSNVRFDYLNNNRVVLEFVKGAYGSLPETQNFAVMHSVNNLYEGMILEDQTSPTAGTWEIISIFTTGNIMILSLANWNRI